MGADLNAYAQVEDGSGCCPSSTASPLPIAEVGGCCSGPLSENGRQHALPK